MKTKNISLCEGHKGGFGFIKVMSPTATYRGTPIKELKVILTDQMNCIQCKADKKARSK